jgi:glycosyltransferase involved in cell wall biosynthesis
MIVKDEGAVIRRCLESVKPLIDSWAIVDTGSTDNTRGIIHEVMGDKPGSLTDEPQPVTKWWQRKRPFDFARNRNVALDAARKFGADYILLIDADEAIKLNEGANGEFPHLDQDRYVANFRQLPEGRLWHRSLLIRASVPWYYKWRVHETLHADSPEATAAILGGLEVHSYSDGGRNQDKTAKYLKDAAACRAEIRREPNEPRHWFYLGQSYAGAGEFLKAIRAYERRIEMGGGWDEELWYAMFQLAPLGQLLGYHWRDVLAAYLRAFNARPWRAEPLWAAGCICRDNGEPALGEAYLRQACRITYPQDSFLVDEAVYAWKAADDLCGCLAMLGYKDECISILERLSLCKDVPDAEIIRIVSNIEKAKAA